MSRLTEDQADRYSRQLMLDVVDTTGQEALLDASVLVVGAGGLGSPVIQYLAAAGIGHLGIADRGVVKRSNLQRQIIHSEATIGQPKVASAAEFVQQLNSDVHVDTIQEPVQANNVESLLSPYDVVVDGLDGFEARYLLNEAAQEQHMPFVHGAVHGFVGQMIVFTPGGPCYRCLYPEQPTWVPSDEPIGIFPVVPGAIGCMEATETLKGLLEIGELRDDRLLRFEALESAWFESPVKPDPACPVCGDPSTRPD